MLGLVMVIRVNVPEELAARARFVVPTLRKPEEWASLGLADA
jgi:hypothetical protein